MDTRIVETLKERHWCHHDTHAIVYKRKALPDHMEWEFEVHDVLGHVLTRGVASTQTLALESALRSLTRLHKHGYVL